MGIRVLLADEHPLYREAVARQIFKFYPGASVEEASSLDQAMALAHASRPGLFILNYGMPGMSAKAIAAVASAFGGVPILVVADGGPAAECVSRWQPALSHGRRVAWLPPLRAGEFQPH